MANPVDPQRRSIQQAGGGKLLRILFVSREEQIVGSSAVNLREQVSRRTERERHLVTGLLLESRRQLLQRVIEVGRSRDSDLLRRCERRKRAQDENKDRRYSH